MRLPSWLRFATSALQRARFQNGVRRRPVLLGVEQLETRLTPSFVLSTLASFNGTNGSSPEAALVMDGSGNLYGTTNSGYSPNGYGTVFEVPHGSGTITTLAAFNGSNGREAYGRLIIDSSGNLYGTTYAGGTANDGTVFELGQGSGTITTLASFNGTNGANPYAGLVMDGSGNLYGTTNRGGASGAGTVFEVAHGSGTITTIASFNSSTGAGPQGGLLLDSSGNLYGTTTTGGGSGDGTVFEIASGSGTITPLALFSRPGYPQEALIMDGSGNLYGTTGATWVMGTVVANGTVFELAHGSSTITTLATFNGADGTDPDGPLVMDSSGNLYDTTYSGGAANDGTVFELPAGGSTITTLASLNGSNGQTPWGGLVMDNSGNLYGATQGGGASNFGTVFELVNGIALTPTTLPSATVGASYSQTLAANGGTAPYTFAVTAGSLPAGLTLSSAGVLSGTPTAAGSTSFTVTATDSTGATGSQAYTLTAYPATFSVTGFPSSITAGGTGTIAVEALDANGNVIPSYTGTVHFTSSDPQAVLPANYTFTAADQGVHTFTATLKTAGSQSLTATDTANGAIVGSESSISVTPAAAASLAFSNVPSSTKAGSAFTLTLTAKDAYGNTATGYTGTFHFTSSDARAVLPANYVFASSDAGSHTFSVTLKTAGTQSVTATDTVTSSLTATASGIVVNPAATSKFVLIHEPAAAVPFATPPTRFASTGSGEANGTLSPGSCISAPSSVTHGVAFSVTLTVEDAYGNVVTGYTGTVHFSSSDGTASLPANYTVTAADAGVHTFTGVILRKKGKQTLTVTDIVNSALTATDSISVS